MHCAQAFKSKTQNRKALKTHKIQKPKTQQPKTPKSKLKTQKPNTPKPIPNINKSKKHLKLTTKLKIETMMNMQLKCESCKVRHV